MSDSQGIEGRALKLLLDLRAKVRGGARLTFESLGEELAFDRLIDHRAGGGDPYAAAGKAPLQVGNDRSIRSDHKTDQFRDRLDGARDHAGALGRATRVLRSLVVNVGVRQH